MDNLCIVCKTRPVEVKKRQMCRPCYHKIRYEEYKKRTGFTNKNIRYDTEVMFIKNYFTHNNWIYHPVFFRLDGCGYEPDFYDGERNVFIEVVGTRQAFHANFEKYELFIKNFPKIKFEIRDVQGKLKPLTKGAYVRKQDNATNKS